MFTSQWDGPRSTISPTTASPRCGMYRPERGMMLTHPSRSVRTPSCAAKISPFSLNVPGPGFSPGPPPASPGMTIGRSDPLPCIGLSHTRGASKRRGLLEVLGGADLSEPLIRLQDPRPPVPLRLRVQPLEELRLHPRGHLHAPDPRPCRGPLLLHDRAEGLDVAVALRAVLRAQLHGDPSLLEPDREER